MKYSVFYVAILTFILGSCSEDDIEPIQKDCKKILSELNNYKSKTINLSSSETNTHVITGYYNDNKLVFAVVEAQTALESEMDQFFFDGDDVEYVKKTIYSFNKPITYTQEVAAQVHDSDYYNPKKTKITSNKYYFYHDRLIKWINSENKSQNSEDKKYDFEKKVLLEDVKKLRSMLQEAK